MLLNVRCGGGQIPANAKRLQFPSERHHIRVSILRFPAGAATAAEFRKIEIKELK